jgi:predicted nuclease with TOPRIM domain
MTTLRSQNSPDNLPARVDALENNVNEILKSLERIELSNKEQFSDMMLTNKEQFSKIESRFDKLESRFDKLDKATIALLFLVLLFGGMDTVVNLPAFAGLFKAV